MLTYKDAECQLSVPGIFPNETPVADNRLQPVFKPLRLLVNMALAEEEQQRAAHLLDAQSKAIKLFTEIKQSLIRPGISEKTLSDEIHALAADRYGVKTHWHKRTVRSGPNTLQPYAANPPDRIIAEDDILFVDLGPVFEEWEADFGLTYVLPLDDEDGTKADPEKKKLRDALEPIWHDVKASYAADPDMTGGQLYDIACKAAEEQGYNFGADIAGHIVGDFPHERIPRDKITLYITRGNDQSMNSVGKDGFKRHWILEIHLHDKQGRFGGFMEQLLTVE
jgi:hypothetical protein